MANREVEPFLLESADEVNVTSALMTDGSGRFLYRKQPCILIITERLLKVISMSRVSSKTLVVQSTNDLVGMSYSPSTPRETTSFYVEFIFYPPKKALCGQSRSHPIRRHRLVVLVLFTSSSHDECLRWNQAVHQAARSHSTISSIISQNETLQSPGNGQTFDQDSPANKIAETVSTQTTTHSLQRRFLVIISPKSGAGHAMTYWLRTVRTVFDDADCFCDVLVTERYRHALDHFANVLTDEQILSYDAIITLGGDGIVYEVINGVMARRSPGLSDAEQEAVNLSLLKRMTVFPLGGGTGNGLIASILHSKGERKDVLNAAFLAVKGRRQGLDLARMTTVTNSALDLETNSASLSTSHYSFLTLLWGTLADVDLESEWLRCLGELRLYVYAVKAIVQRRLYRGQVSLKLAQLPSVNSSNATDSLHHDRINQLRNDEIVDADGWLHIEDEFLAVNVFQTSHLATTTHACPGKRQDDGVFIVAIVDKTCSRATMINMLLTIDSGGLLQSSAVRIFRCSSFVLDPRPSPGVGQYSLDGERIPYGRVAGEILPAATNIFL